MGSNQICVGNSTGLSIHNIGSVFISSPRRSFILKQLLHVPSICKNMLFVSQFTQDNSVFFEFHSFFVIKDCRTKSSSIRVLLRTASISCCLLPPPLLLLLRALLLVKGLSLINGTNTWVTLLYALLSKY
jgi:hypothetical protein